MRIMAARAHRNAPVRLVRSTSFQTVEAGFEDVFGARDAGVVDQHVEATECAIDGGEHGRDGRLVADVAVDDQARRPLARTARGQPFGGDRACRND